MSDRWPSEFTLGYLAKRAGMTTQQVRRLIKRIPALATLVKPDKWTKISLDDIQRAAPGLFRSIQIRDETWPEEAEE